ncbi:MAG: response regulator transcription factor [Chitinophagales bacterium]
MDIIRLAIAEHYLITIEGIIARLRDTPEIKIMHFALGGDNLIENLANFDTDILLIAADLRNCNYVLSAVTKKFPDIKIITMTFTIDEGYLELLCNCSPHGSVMKDDASFILIEAIKQVALHGYYYSSTVERQLHDFERKRSSKTLTILLTPRDIEILKLMEKGMSHDEIAMHLKVKKSTIDGHCKNIFSKLGIHKAQQAINEAHRLGILK